MKTIIKLSFTGLVISILLSSCTMGKRVYMPGYHIEMNNFRLKQARKEEVKINKEIKIAHNHFLASEQPEIETNVTDNNVTIEDNLYVSADSSLTMLPEKPINTLLLGYKTKLKAEQKEYKVKSSSDILSETADEENPYSGVAIAGFSCGMAELTYFALLLTGAFAGISTLLGLFVVFVLPVLLLVSTLVLSINGLRMTGEWKKKGKGFALAGLIIGGSIIFGLLYLFYYLVINGGYNSRGI